MYAIDVGNWRSVLGMRSCVRCAQDDKVLKGDRKGSPIGTNLRKEVKEEGSI